MAGTKAHRDLVLAVDKLDDLCHSSECATGSVAQRCYGPIIVTTYSLFEQGQFLDSLVEIVLCLMRLSRVTTFVALNLRAPGVLQISSQLDSGYSSATQVYTVDDLSWPSCTRTVLARFVGLPNPETHSCCATEIPPSRPKPVSKE
jgi:hypothetical protein